MTDQITRGNLEAREVQVRATYLVANAAWVVTFGDQIITLEDKSGPFPRFFSDLEELSYCLKLCGLKRGRTNTWNTYTIR
jgi:hypothetical protein